MLIPIWIPIAMILALLTSCKHDRRRNNVTDDKPVTAEAADISLEHARQQIEIGYRSTERDPPSTAPKPQRGRNVWVISPGQASETASVPTAAAKEAGEAIGWRISVFD